MIDWITDTSNSCQTFCCISRHMWWPMDVESSKPRERSRSRSQEAGLGFFCVLYCVKIPITSVLVITCPRCMGSSFRWSGRWFLKLYAPKKNIYIYKTHMCVCVFFGNTSSYNAGAGVLGQEGSRKKAESCKTFRKHFWVHAFIGPDWKLRGYRGNVSSRPSSVQKCATTLFSEWIWAQVVFAINMCFGYQTHADIPFFAACQEV